jgi:hypothetical protein
MQGATRTVAQAYWKYVGAEDRRSNAADGSLSTAAQYRLLIPDRRFIVREPHVAARPGGTPGPTVKSGWEKAGSVACDRPVFPCFPVARRLFGKSILSGRLFCCQAFAGRTIEVVENDAR